MHFSLQKLARIAIAALVVLLIAAVYFYKERMLFIDAAYICSKILNTHRLAIEEYRYGCFITQMVPLLASKLGCSLRTILIAYSLSFNLFYLVVAMLLYRLRAYQFVILLSLYFTLYVSDTFFWTNNEVHQGTAWLLLSFATIFYLEKKYPANYALNIPVFLILSALAIFSHPLVIISAAFLWLFVWIGKEHWVFTKKTAIIYSMVLLLIVAAKFVLSNIGDGYDAGRMHNVTHCTLPQIIALFNGPVGAYFINNLLTKYWWVLIIFIAGVYALVKQKKYKLLWFTILSALAFYIFMGLTYGEEMLDRNVVFYMESEWMTLSIIIAAPFIFYFLPSLKSGFAMAALVVIIVSRFVYIGTAAQKFTSRIHFINSALTEMKQRHITKAIVVENGTLKGKVFSDWALPMESLMLSALNGDDPHLTFVAVPAEKLPAIANTAKNDMINCFLVSSNDLNTRYFKPDTTQGYTILKYEELFGR